MYPAIAHTGLIQVHDEAVVLDLPLDEQLVEHELHDDDECLGDGVILIGIVPDLANVDHQDGPVLVVPAAEVERS